MAEFRRSALALPAYREAALRLERGADPKELYQEKITCDGELQEVEDSDESTSGLGPYGQAGDVRRITRTPRKAAAGNAG
jgi:hypothetical protein